MSSLSALAMKQVVAVLTGLVMGAAGNLERSRDRDGEGPGQKDFLMVPPAS